VAHLASCKSLFGLFAGVIRPGHCVDHPSPYKANIKNENIYTSTPCVSVGMLLGDLLFIFTHEKYIVSYGNLLKPYRNNSDFAALKDDQASLHKIVFFTNEWLRIEAIQSVNLDIFFLSWMTHTMSSGRTSVQERLGIRWIITAAMTSKEIFLTMKDT